MSVNIGQLFRKRTVRKLDGSIYDLVDEADGGVIISKGRIVNQEKIDELAKKQKDRETAAQAITQQVSHPTAPDRTSSPSKVDALEKKVEGMETKLDAILKALQK